MEELKVGQKVTLEVAETNKASCNGCFFDSKGICEVWKKYPCSSKQRSDGKNIIFKKAQKNNFGKNLKLVKKFGYSKFSQYLCTKK